MIYIGLKFRVYKLRCLDEVIAEVVDHGSKARKVLESTGAVGIWIGDKFWGRADDGLLHFGKRTISIKSIWLNIRLVYTLSIDITDALNLHVLRDVIYE